MPVHQDIRNWIPTLPLWQQDALRRLDEQQSLGEKDIDELALLAKAEGGIPLPENLDLAVRPLILPDPSITEGAGAVTLSELRGLQNINALADDQPIQFPPTGITVIFGDNGSGKSGFGRLLRTVCWARQPAGTILRNIDAKDDQPQQATIVYRIGTEEQPPYQWTPEQTPPEALGQIAVYDIDCGAVYVNEEQQSAYIPFGLDYFPRLAQICDRVREKLKLEHDAAVAGLPTWPDVDLTTDMGKQLVALPSVSAKKAIDDCRPLDATETERAAHLTKLLAELQRDDPHKRVLGLRNDARKWRDLKTGLQSLQSALNDGSAATLKAAFLTAKTKTAAAKVASDKVFGTGVLHGTGTAVWEELWNAARKYSETAYPSVEFPACEHGERCVLCQQLLLPEASARLKAFDEFVKDEAATQAQRANADVEELKRTFETLVCLRPDHETLCEDLDLKEANLGKDYKSWLETAEKRRKVLASALSEEDVDELPALLEPPAARPETLAKAAEEEATTLADSIDDAARAANKQELAELVARKWVCDNRPAIVEVIERLRVQALLGKLLGAPTSTTKITTMGNALTETHVTVAHKERFRTELATLRAAHLGVELVKRGVKGKTLHQLLLTRGEGHSIASVLSTGERNIVGLAAFFAELQPDRGHSIILDDPVSSLDQDRRDDVGRRIAAECTKRQVIVWTHDLTFVGALFEAVEAREKASVSVVTLTNVNGVAGIVDQRLPWPLMKIKERLKRLKVDLEELQKIAQAKKAKEYEDAGRLFYGRLRDSWERAVEEVLFNEVILRWQKGIRTQRLEGVADKVTRADFETIDAEMTRCSNYAHDQAGQTPPPLPLVSQLETDLKTLADWVANKRKA